MSIVTKTGDTGTTSLMYGRRVSKCHPRVQACGSIDELSCALGAARVASNDPEFSARLESIQRDLVLLMGELATASEDLARYAKDGFQLFPPGPLDSIEDTIRKLESAGVVFRGWAMPGANQLSTALDMARAICRRAERAVCAVHEDSPPSTNPAHLAYLNRLSDLLWLLARDAEKGSRGFETSTEP